jgi:hypothetical protein
VAPIKLVGIPAAAVFLSGVKGVAGSDPVSPTMFVQVRVLLGVLRQGPDRMFGGSCTLSGRGRPRFMADTVAPEVGSRP